MMKVLACLWLVAMSSAHASSLSKAVAAFPDLPRPLQGETQWVARSMRMNGLPMTIQSLTSRSVPSEVIHFYQSWATQRGGAQTRRWRTHDSEVLSIRAASYLVTIELRQVVSGSQGTIVMSSPPEKAMLNTVTEFPHPTSWRVANLQQYEDDGKETEHITFTSVHVPASEAQAIMEMLAANGWILISKHSSRVNDFSAELQRNTELARVVITSGTDHLANTLVTVLWSKG
jgi:hypothetical protein